MEARDWSPSALDPGSRAVKVAAGLTLTGQLPGSFGAAYRCSQNWEGYSTLSFDLKLPAGHRYRLRGAIPPPILSAGKIELRLSAK